MGGGKGGGGVVMPAFRAAERGDLAAIIGLLADDPLGKYREAAEKPLERRYLEAFAAISADPRQVLAVGVVGGEVVGCLQITVIPGLSRFGESRGQIEGVRVTSRHRGQGIGGAMMRWAVEECRARGCGVVQLTTDKRRVEAQRFYRGLGFEASHEGMKLALAP